MSNINWTVEACEIHNPSPYTLPTIEVSLAGMVDVFYANTSKNVKDIIKDIEDKLNSPVKPEYVPYDKMMKKYIQKDVEITKEIAHVQSHGIKNVIFNDPATIVFWLDGTKTVVKCGEGDIFDPEKGLAMAIAKKAFGNQGNYYNEIKKWVGADIYMNEKTYKHFMTELAEMLFPLNKEVKK